MRTKDRHISEATVSLKLQEENILQISIDCLSFHSCFEVLNDRTDDTPSPFIYLTSLEQFPL